MDERAYSIMTHLKELRISLWRALLGALLSSSLCLYFSDTLLYVLRRPMERFLGPHIKFVVLSPLEYFFAQMKVGVVAGIFVASPWILWQLWRFIAPGLHQKEKKLAAAFVCTGSVFFVLGALFAYFFMFPFMFEFFVSTLPQDVEGAFSIGLLYGLCTSSLLAFGVVFETPVIVFLLSTLGIVEVEAFAAARRYVIVGCFVVAAILTPPDPISQVMLAVPLVILYEVGILAARIFRRRDNKEAAVAS